MADPFRSIIGARRGTTSREEPPELTDGDILVALRCSVGRVMSADEDDVNALASALHHEAEAFGVRVHVLPATFGAETHDFPFALWLIYRDEEDLVGIIDAHGPDDIRMLKSTR